jgi:hypothetical protein
MKKMWVRTRLLMPGQVKRQTSRAAGKNKNAA